MLGKQGWRFLTNPDSLVSRLYKARYFVETDFLNSNLGHNPSFVWKTIFEAKKLLLDGIRWRIGSGEDINIVGQPWLLQTNNSWCITTVSQMLENAKVAFLFCMERKEWDVDIIWSC